MLDVKTGRIREAVLTAAGTDGDPPDRVIVGKDKAGDDKFRLRNVPEGREIKGERFLRYIGESLDNLTLEDVRPAGEVDYAGKAAGGAVFRTFDGLVVTAKLARTG